MKHQTHGQTAGRIKCALSAVLLAGSAWSAHPLQSAPDETTPGDATPAEQSPQTDQAGQADTQEPEEADLPLAGVIELASAYRLREELSALLDADGRAAAGADGSDENRLAGLATRCAVLANSVQSQQARAVLLDCQARANASLAQLAADGPEQTRQRRLQQLRSAAEKIRALEVPTAQPAADYWVLLADLAEAVDLGDSVGPRQVLARRLLTAYLDKHRGSRAGREYVIDARLSLAHLLDERGDQRGAMRQVEAIGELPEDSPRLLEVERLTARAARIGKAVQFEGVTTGLEVWRLSDHAGQPVLLHLYADAVQPSLDMIDQITDAIAARALGGFRVVSLRVGEPVAGSKTAPWPTIPIGLEPGGVVDKLGIDALPTLVWIDADGEVASIGHALAVLEQAPAREDGDAGDREGRESVDPPPAGPGEGPGLPEAVPRDEPG